MLERWRKGELSLLNTLSDMQRDKRKHHGFAAIFSREIKDGAMNAEVPLAIARSGGSSAASLIGSMGSTTLWILLCRVLIS